MVRRKEAKLQIRYKIRWGMSSHSVSLFISIHMYEYKQFYAGMTNLQCSPEKIVRAAISLDW